MNLTEEQIDHVERLQIGDKCFHCEGKIVGESCPHHYGFVTRCDKCKLLVKPRGMRFELCECGTHCVLAVIEGG